MVDMEMVFEDSCIGLLASSTILLMSQGVMSSTFESGILLSNMRFIHFPVALRGTESRNGVGLIHTALAEGME